MTQRSRFHDGTSTGDATEAPYSAQEFAQVVLGLLAQNNVSPWQRSFVSFGQGYGVGSLLVTGTATPVSIAAGIACVAGMWYELDAATTLAVATPAVNPRRDRVVLRADWSAQTIRLALLAGTEAATPTAPALTQTFGTTWEVSLATVYITTGGVITVTDERPGNIGLGSSVLFRDIAQREYEEFFDNFNSGDTPSGWTVVLTGTGNTGENNAVPSSLLIQSGVTNGGIARIFRGVTGARNTAFSQAPLLMEWRASPLGAAADAQTTVVGRLANSGASIMVEFGVIGSISTSNLVLRSTNAGATSFNTGQAIDTSGAYHTFGILVPASGGPVFALYDDVVIGQVAANLPASGTQMKPEWLAGNGTTNADRRMLIDWARLVRGTA